MTRAVESATALSSEPLSEELLRSTIYRLDGPLRWAVGENIDLVRKGRVERSWRVLDVGCGTGYLSIPLAETVGPTGRVHCLDQSPGLQEALHNKAVQKGLGDVVETVSSDATAIPYEDDSFDSVFTSYTLHEFADQAPKVIQEMYRVLKPNHSLVIADYRRLPDEERCAEVESWYGAQKSALSNEIRLRFSLEDLELMLLNAGFRQVTLSTWCEFHMHAVAVK